MEASQISIRSGIEELGIFEKNADAWVSTRVVAKLFGKEHSDILWQIRDKILPNVSEAFNRGNFPLVKYRDAKGEKRPEYLLNRKWFSRKAKREGVTQARLFSEMRDAYLKMQEADRVTEEASR